MSRPKGHEDDPFNIVYRPFSDEEMAMKTALKQKAQEFLEVLERLEYHRSINAAPEAIDQARGRLREACWWAIYSYSGKF